MGTFAPWGPTKDERRALDRWDSRALHTSFLAAGSFAARGDGSRGGASTRASSFWASSPVWRKGLFRSSLYELPGPWSPHTSTLPRRTRSSRAFGTSPSPTPLLELNFCMNHEFRLAYNSPSSNRSLAFELPRTIEFEAPISHLAANPIVVAVSFILLRCRFRVKRASQPSDA